MCSDTFIHTFIHTHTQILYTHHTHTHIFIYTFICIGPCTHTHTHVLRTCTWFDGEHLGGQRSGVVDLNCPGVEEPFRAEVLVC